MQTIHNQITCSHCLVGVVFIQSLYEIVHTSSILLRTRHKVSDIYVGGNWALPNAEVNNCIVFQPHPGFHNMNTFYSSYDIDDIE